MIKQQVVDVQESDLVEKYSSVMHKATIKLDDSQLIMPDSDEIFAPWDQQEYGTVLSYTTAD